LRVVREPRAQTNSFGIADLSEPPVLKTRQDNEQPEDRSGQQKGHPGFLSDKPHYRANITTLIPRSRHHCGRFYILNIFFAFS